VGAGLSAAGRIAPVAAPAENPATIRKRLERMRRRDGIRLATVAITEDDLMELVCVGVAPRAVLEDQSALSRYMTDHMRRWAAQAAQRRAVMSRVTGPPKKNAHGVSNLEKP